MNMYVKEERTELYKKAVEKNAEGKFYTGDINKMASNIVNEIKDTKTSVLNSNTKTYVTDHPQVFLILIILLFISLIIIEKRISL